MSNKLEAALHGRTLQDELRTAAQESPECSLLTRAADALDEQDRELDSALSEQDRLTEWADQLAWAIAPLEEIGEHTSANNPWANAIEAAESSTRIRVDGDTVERAARSLHSRLRFQVGRYLSQWENLPHEARLKLIEDARAVLTDLVPKPWARS